MQHFGIGKKTNFKMGEEEKKGGIKERNKIDK
jgi:hypothetical protein